VFFLIFSITERTTKKRATEHAELDQFNLEGSDDLTPERLGVRPGNVLVMVRNYNTLFNLNSVLERVDPRTKDVVVLHLRFLRRSGAGEYELTHDQLFSLNEQKLFTRALEIAEKKGKTIHLAVAAATDKWEAILRAAQSLQSSAIALGASPNTSVVEDARTAGLTWERLPDPQPQLALQFYYPSGQDQIFYLGPHAPHLTPKEIDLLHGVWLELSSEVAPDEVHHHDVVHFALEELQLDLSNSKRCEVVKRLRQHLDNIKTKRVPALR
jgi:DNA-binding PucR family transcriptional regulator